MLYIAVGIICVQGIPGRSGTPGSKVIMVNVLSDICVFVRCLSGVEEKRTTATYRFSDLEWRTNTHNIHCWSFTAFVGIEYENPCGLQPPAFQGNLLS